MHSQRGIPCERHYFRKNPTEEVPRKAYGHFSPIRTSSQKREFALTTLIPNDTPSNTHTAANMIQLLVNAIVRFPENTAQ